MNRFCIVLLVLFGVLLGCNKRMANLHKTSDGFLEMDQFAMRTKPILNREYILYLSWSIDVYGDVFPKRILDILPEGSIDDNVILNLGYRQIPTASRGILRDYILNPKYLNHPLIGLQERQVLELQKWLTDRYCENKLIELGRYRFNPNQKDEDCFVMEAYLSHQYMGDVRNDKPIEWEDGIFKPNFRLPFSDELEQAKKMMDGLGAIKNYRFTKSDFLWLWNEYYIQQENDRQITLNLIDPIRLTAKEVDATSSLPEAVLGIGREELAKDAFYPPLEGIREIEFSKYPFKEKNDYGQMEFVIIGNGKDNRPIGIYGGMGDRVGAKKVDANQIYRIVYSKAINEKYWP